MQKINERIFDLRKTVIEPNGKNLQYWRDIWNYRELAYNLAKRDITVRYKQTRIGLGWAVIAPIISMFVSTFIFGTLAGLSSDGNAPYFIMVYAGSIPWSAFQKNVNQASSTFITNANLMKKVYYPRILSPIGACMAGLFDSVVSIIILIILMFGAGYYPTARFLLFPLFLLLNSALGLFLGLFLSAFNVKWRDMAQIVPFVLSVAQYICPVSYSITSIPEKYRLVYSLNPATGMISAFKWCVISDMTFDWLSFGVAVAWLALLTVAGIILFRKTERNFVDIV